MATVPANISPEAVALACGTRPSETKDFVFQQTMIRIKDPVLSLRFYSQVLGMTLVKQMDFPGSEFSLFFFAYLNPSKLPTDPKERAVIALSTPASLELTYNWGSEKQADFSHHNGNSDPRGFGHIGITVPDVEAACARFEQMSVKFVKKPNDGKMKGLAFIQDPDGYWIEIFNPKMAEEL